MAFQKAGDNEAAADFFQRALSEEPQLRKNFNLRLGLATARYLAHQPAAMISMSSLRSGPKRGNLITF